MPKLEDILRSKGYTDADLATFAPMLADARFRSTLEDQYANMETERDLFKTRAEELETWRTGTAVPEFDKIAAREANARTEAASLREQLQIARDYGYLPASKEPAPGAPPQDPAAARAAEFDPKKYNLLTQTDANEFAKLQGRAMATFQSISAEHQRLFGAPIDDFEKLFDEATASQKNIRQVWETKYGVQAKRTELDEKRRKDSEDAIRADERSKVAAQFGNPNLRSASPSRFPFIPAKSQEGKQPWESSPSELRERRLGNAMKNQVQ